MRAPHGGIFVLFAVHNILGFLIALVLGVVVGSGRVIALKTHRPAADTETSPPSDHRLRPSRSTNQKENACPRKTVAVGSAVGLHARPAAIIAEAAGELDSEVTIGVPGDDPVDASSALLIMTLGAGKGATVEVSGDDQAAVDTIAALVEQDLDA